MGHLPHSLISSPEKPVGTTESRNNDAVASVALCQCASWFCELVSARCTRLLRVSQCGTWQSVFLFSCEIRICEPSLQCAHHRHNRVISVMHLIKTLAVWTVQNTKMRRRCELLVWAMIFMC